MLHVSFDWTNYSSTWTYLKNSSRKEKHYYKFNVIYIYVYIAFFCAGDLNLIFAMYVRKSWKRNLVTFAWLSWPVEILPLPPSPTSKPQVVVFTNILLQSLDIFHELSISHFKKIVTYQLKTTIWQVVLYMIQRSMTLTCPCGWPGHSRSLSTSVPQLLTQTLPVVMTLTKWWWQSSLRMGSCHL